MAADAAAAAAGCLLPLCEQPENLLRAACLSAHRKAVERKHTSVKYILARAPVKLKLYCIKVNVEIAEIHEFH